MVKLVVSDEQAKVIAEARDTVTILDSRGRCLGFIAPDDSPEEIAEAKQRLLSNQKRYTTAEVLAHLNALEDSTKGCHA